MTTNSNKSRRILFIIFDKFELLDLSGPSSVFNSVNTLLGQQAYEVRILSSTGGLITSNAAIGIQSDKIETVTACSNDTILIVGGDKPALKSAISDLHLQKWLLKESSIAERLGSVCSGAFLLAQHGLLDGKNATTHWAGIKKLKTLFPQVKVKNDALYCIDDKVWTSAGVTTGIDMTLMMVARDYNHSLTQEIAQWLVVYVQRPGNQSQFSSLAQAQTDDEFTHLILWLEENLQLSIKVSDMADKCAMSERTFYRKFTNKTGYTPSKFLEQRRLLKAKDLLISGKAIKTVYPLLGYQSELGFCKAFKATYGLSPALFKRLHANN